MHFLKWWRGKGGERAHGPCAHSIEFPCLTVAESWGGQAQLVADKGVSGLVCIWIFLEDMEEGAAASYSHCMSVPGLLLLRGDVAGDCLDHWVNTLVAPGRRSDLGWLFHVPHKLQRASLHSAIAMKTLAFCFPLSEHIASGKPCGSSLPSPPYVLL